MPALAGDAIQQLLDAIADYELANRRAPTVRNLATALHCSSSKAFDWIVRARDAGAIEYEPGIPRSIRVAGSRCPACGR